MDCSALSLRTSASVRSLMNHHTPKTQAATTVAAAKRISLGSRLQERHSELTAGTSGAKAFLTRLNDRHSIQLCGPSMTRSHRATAFLCCASSCTPCSGCQSRQAPWADAARADEKRSAGAQKAYTASTTRLPAVPAQCHSRKTPARQTDRGPRIHSSANA